MKIASHPAVVTTDVIIELRASVRHAYVLSIVRALFLTVLILGGLEVCAYWLLDDQRSFSHVPSLLTLGGIAFIVYYSINTYCRHIRKIFKKLAEAELRLSRGEIVNSKDLNL